jgi:hypothetical protein
MGRGAEGAGEDEVGLERLAGFQSAVSPRRARVKYGILCEHQERLQASAPLSCAIVSSAVAEPR